MKIHCIFSVLLLIPLLAFGQYPNNPNKMRLGFQTTGDGLIFRGVIADTAIKPIGLFNAYFLLDTVGARLYRYIRTRGRWQLAGTDSQTLSFTSPNLSISGGNSVNLSGLLSGYPSGTGTTNTLPIWTSSTTLGNSIVSESSGELIIGGTGSVRLPNGTTAQRPTHGGGKFRWNPTNGAADISDGTNWRRLTMQTDAAFGANHVPFANSAGVLEGSSSLTWDNTNTTFNVRMSGTLTSSYKNIATFGPTTFGRNLSIQTRIDPFNTGANDLRLDFGNSRTYFMNSSDFFWGGRHTINSGGSFWQWASNGTLFGFGEGNPFRNPVAGGSDGNHTRYYYSPVGNGTGSAYDTYYNTGNANIDRFNVQNFNFFNLHRARGFGTILMVGNTARNTTALAAQNDGRVEVNGYFQTADAFSAALTLHGTDLGFLPNRLTTAQRDALGSRIMEILLTSAGSGYNGAQTVTISGGGGTGATAAFLQRTFPGSISAITLTNEGSGYTSTPTVTISGGGGTGAAAVAVMNAPRNGLTIFNTTTGQLETYSTLCNCWRSGGNGIYGGSGNLQANNTDVRYDASGTSKMRFGNFTAAKEWYLDLVSDGSFNNALQISANSSNFGGGFQTANFAMTSGIYSGRNITTQFSTALTQATGTKSGEFSYSLGYHSNRTGGGHFLKYDSAAVQGGAFLSYSFDNTQGDTNGDKQQVAGLFRGTVSAGNYDRVRASTPSFLVQTVTRGVSTSSFFDWLRIDNLDTDTTSNRVWLYGKYALPNAAPRTASDARSVVEWAGTGSAATPSFVASGVFTESSVRTASFTIDSVKLLGVEEYRAWCEIPSVGGSLLDIQFPKPGAIWERKQIVIVAEDENATFSIDAFCTSGNHFYYWNAGAMTAQASYSITAASTDYTGPGATVIFRCINRGGTYYWVPGLTGK